MSTSGKTAEESASTCHGKTHPISQAGEESKAGCGQVKCASEEVLIYQKSQEANPARVSWSKLAAKVQAWWALLAALNACHMETHLRMMPNGTVLGHAVLSQPWRPFRIITHLLNEQ